MNVLIIGSGGHEQTLYFVIARVLLFEKPLFAPDNIDVERIVADLLPAARQVNMPIRNTKSNSSHALVPMDKKRKPINQGPFGKEKWNYLKPRFCHYEL